MFRIIQVPTSSGIILNIDGQLTREYAQFADEYCSALLGEGIQLNVVLRDVSVVDEVGKAFLAGLASQGVHIRANGVYMTYLLDEIRHTASDANSLP